MGLSEKVVLVNDPDEINKYDINNSPAIVIDGNAVSEGKLLSVDEIVRLIEKA